MHKLISTLKKKKKKRRRGMNCRTFSQNPRTRRKSHHHPKKISCKTLWRCFYLCHEVGYILSRPKRIEVLARFGVNTSACISKKIQRLTCTLTGQRAGVAWREGVRLISRRTSVRSSSALLSLQKIVVYGHCLVTLPTQFMKHQNDSHSCPP